jgi:hypothetical protein
MNIGIYGDSFAFYNKNCPEFNWTTILGKKFTDSTVNHYGKYSTSVYYSYKMFLDKYYKNDINIFLVTNPSRYTKTIKINNQELILAYINSVESYKKENIKNLLPIDVKILDDLIGWYISSDQEFLSTASELMINQIQALDNKVIFFPCFKDSLTNEQYKKYEIPQEHYMSNYVQQIKKILNMTEPDVSHLERSTVISQHLTPEFNHFVADFMYKKITTGFWDFSNFQNIKIEYPREYYYKQQ